MESIDTPGRNNLLSSKAIVERYNVKKLIPILLILLALSTACGGSDDSSSEQAESGGLSAGEQAIADHLAADFTSDSDFPFSDSAVCIAETSVSEIGLDKLVVLGITEDSTMSSLEDQPAEVQEVFINSILDCIGTSGLATLLVESSEEDEDGPALTAEDAECIGAGIDREQWLEFLKSSFLESEMSSDDGEALFAEILKECPQILVNSLKADLGLDQTQAECLADVFSETLIEAFAFGEQEGDPSPEVFEEILLAFIGCGVDMSQLE